MSLDLTAVCERHDIEVDYFEMLKPDARWEARFWWDAEDCESFNAPTKEEAVCALLKARYSIGTQRRSGSQTIDGRTEYTATGVGVGGDRSYPTELAAVVALADRLLDVKEASRGES